MAAFKLPSLSLKKRRRQLSLPEFRWNSITLKEELGRGTFGTVYLATCTGEEQCVVIKKLKGEAAVAKRRFEKEAAILYVVFVAVVVVELMFETFTVFRSKKKLWNRSVAPAQAIQFIDSNSSVSDQEVLQYIVIRYGVIISLYAFLTVNVK